jgi:hypothetical protein
MRSIGGVILTVEDRVWSFGGMLMTGKTEVLGEKPAPTVTLSNTKLTWTHPRSKSSLRSMKLDVLVDILLLSYYYYSFLPQRKTDYCYLRK